ncbi:MAG: hypothetical protein RJA61_549 [Candidatus Parcubacteria bacterium]|jgi:uncharacterized membrane protein YkgB
MLQKIDNSIISTAKKIFIPYSRLALFIVFFWFGILKLIDVSPANPIVSDLLEKTLPFISFGQFIIFLGVWEMLIGICFLIPRCERFAILLLVPHMITTCMPLILLPQIAWQSFLVPTLEGQYIIKNLVIIALAIGIAVQLKPFGYKEEGGKYI